MKPSPLCLVAMLCSWCACSQPETATVGDAAPTVDPGVVKRPAAPRAPRELSESPRMQALRARTSPPDVRTPAQITAAACALPKGGWACKNVKQPPVALAMGGPTTPIIPSSWTVPAWFFDPQNVSGTASDNNNCTTSATACRTWGEIYVHRLDGPNANLQQHTVVTELSSQNSSTDFVSVVLDPNSLPIEFDGTLTTATTATIGTFTARNRTAGTPNTITATGQSGAYWTPFVGDLVHDTTVNAWFWIDADLGSATAKITEPLQQTVFDGTFPPPYVTIANGDALTIDNESLLNITSASCSITLFNLKIAGIFEASPNSDLALLQVSTSIANGFISNKFGLFTSIINSRTTPFSTGAGDAVGGSIVTNIPFAGSLNIGSPVASAVFILDGDVLLDPTVPDNVQSLRPSGYSRVGRAGLFGVFQTNGSNAQTGGGIESSGTIYGGTGAVWGPGQLQVTSGMTYSFLSGTAVDQLLLTGANYSSVPITCEYNTQTTAFPWVAGSNAYGAAVALTPANIDSNSGLTCLPAGSKFWFRP